MNKLAVAAALSLSFSFFSGAALAQPTEPQPTEPPATAEPSPPEPAPPPPAEPSPPLVEPTPPPPPSVDLPVMSEESDDKPMSEGRAISSAWNSGFQWGIAPGIAFVDGKTGFFMGLRFGYGFDTGSVIVVPGVRLAGYFLERAVYLGMPVMKLVYPIDRFAPFIEGGAGVGHVSADGDITSRTAAALMVGGGFMIHFSMKFGLGVEANFQTITGSNFQAFGVGPILALAF
ncbi:MAG: hypothetical protein KF819_25560 [Labilithrix sp.]|nr:hypothetical protein [Labilithrix sp.]